MVDIAHLAGVSTSAVSLALNGRAGVSAETRERIVKIAENLNWHPNVPARALKGAPVSAVGVVITRPARFLGIAPFHMNFLAGLEQQFSQAGISLLMHIADSQTEEIRTYGRWAAERRVDGLILLDLTINDPRLDMVKNLGPPVVVVGDPRFAAGLPCVWTDDASAVRSAVARFTELGHQHLAWVSERSNMVHSRLRTSAFLDACREADLPTPDIVETDATIVSGRQVTHRLLGRRHDRPSAILYDNDLMAVAALGAAREVDLNVPQDVSLIAYDDSILCEITSPSLSALSHDIYSYGGHAAQLLLREIQAPGSTDSERDATPTLIERGSTATARG